MFPKISIITANLNGATTLEKAIQSIIGQDYPNLEYIVIDGGSTDGSLDIIDRYADAIDIVLIEEDHGISDAFNKGIQRATGDLIGIISSDDFLAENILGEVAECYLKNKSPDVIYGDSGFVEDNRITIVRPDPLDKIWVRQPLKHSSVFVARDAYKKWGKFSLKYLNAMDYELVFRFYLAGAKFVYLEKTLSYFSAGGVSQKHVAKTVGEVRNIGIMYGQPKGKVNLTFVGKLAKIYLKRVLLATKLTAIFSLYRFLSPRYCTRGRLITFSGIDGAGKSTQIAYLMKYFQDNGQQPVYLWSRGGYSSFLEKIKVLIRKIIKNSAPLRGHSVKRSEYLSKKGIRKLWLWAALLDLMRVYGIMIRVWQMMGRPVVCDRYLWDTLVDFEINFPEEDVREWLLWKWLRRIAVRPDAAFLFMIPIEESVQRSEIKKDPFPEPLDLRRKRYALYEKLPENGAFHVIDGARPAAEIFAEIKRVIT